MPPTGSRARSFAAWQQLHPWLSSLLRALAVTIPAGVVGVLISGELLGTAFAVLPIFVIWFLGGAIRLRRQEAPL